MKRQKQELDSASSIHDLTDDLMEEIFFRLPIKSVLCCGAVSKRWTSLIFSPAFKKNFVSRSQTLQLPCTVVSNTMYIKGFNEKNIDTLDLLMIINKQNYTSYSSVLAFPQQLHKKRYKEVDGNYYLLDSSNGLFLCIAKSQNLYELIICNPIVKQWKKLPEPTNPISLCNCLGLSFTTQIDGANTITSYKLLIFHQNPYQFEIFSSETAKWTTHNINPLSRHEWPAVANGLNILGNVDDFSHLSRHKFVAVVNGSGIMHWVTENSLRVLAYDPSDKDWYRVINLPRNDQLDETVGVRRFKDIDVFNDNLRYLKIFRTPGQGTHLYIWTLEGYDYGGQWHLDQKVLLWDFRFYAKEFDCKFGQFDMNTLYIWVWSRTTNELLTYDFWTQEITVINKPMEGWNPSMYEPLQIWGLPLMLPVWPATTKVQREL